jgi:hypothetical protein
MPTIELTELELMECARGARALKAQALKDAERMGTTSSRKLFEQAAERHQAMANLFESIAKSAPPHHKRKPPQT